MHNANFSGHLALSLALHFDQPRASAMATDTINWVTEALSNAFKDNTVVVSEPKPKQPAKVVQAWVEQPAQPTAAQVPVIEVSARSKHDTKQWIEQWKLLNKREGLVAAGASCLPLHANSSMQALL